MFITKKHLSRRTVLKAAGVSLSLPLLDAMIPAGTALAQTAAQPKLRAGFFYIPHGAIMWNTPYGKDMDATKGVRFRFVEAGHVLGSAMVLIRAAGADRDRTLAFSGDMGRRNMPILKPTAAIPPESIVLRANRPGSVFFHFNSIDTPLIRAMMIGYQRP